MGRECSGFEKKHYIHFLTVLLQRFSHGEKGKLGTGRKETGA